jgi:hypothetical protein
MSTKKKFYLAKSNQEGGTIENDFKEFSKYLMELIGATTDEELQNFVKEQGPEKVNEIYKQWKEQVPMAKDGMQFASKTAAKSQSALIPGNVAIRNKIQDTAQDDLRGISSFKEAFAEARRRGLRQFSWGKGSYTTELRRADPPPPPPKDAVEGKGGNTNREVPESLKRGETSVQAGTIPKYWDTDRTGFVPSKGESKVAKPAAKPAGKRGGSTTTKTATAVTTPTPVSTSPKPSDELVSLGLKTIGAAGATAGAIYGSIYGAKKYADYKAARPSTPSAQSTPKPSIFRNIGDNVKGYMSKVPFKEKVNEYTSKAASLFKKTPAPTAAPASAPASRASRPGGKPGGRSEVMSGGKPGVRSKVTSKGMSGKSFRPGRTTSLAPRMAGRANMLGMALGTISDLFPSKEDSNRSDALWRIQKRMGYGYRPSEQELREEINPTIFKQGGTVNKLDYINKLNGECPEGYTAVKFAKGGVICTTCQKNKEVAAKKKNHLDSIKEEMKCGGKMKSHQKGGEMTNAQYRKAPLSKKVDQDLRDQAAGRNDGEGGTPKTDSTKVAPKKLIKKPTKK